MPGTASLTARVEAIAQAQPRRRALSDGERRFDYGELWSQACRFAALLTREGLNAGDRVALVLANGVEAAAACYGTWLAGGVVVPLNVQARARDLAPWLRHSAARVVVHAAANADMDQAMRELDAAPMRVAIATGAGAAGPDAMDWASLAITEIGEARSIAAPLASDDLAMLLYTSGTTGAPKGVMLSHRNLATNVDSVVAYLGLTCDDSIVSVLPFYYSYGASVLHTHLSVGARVVLESNLVFPHLVVEAMARERASGFSGVPSTYALLLNRVPLQDYDLSALRYLTQAGGAMTPALTSRLRQALPHVRVYVMYGQTEASARLTYLPPERLDDKLGSVGVPIPGVRLQVRREDGASAAVDEVGDVWVQGGNVMLGYWKNPQASAEVLRDGWLKTGDMGRLDDEGFLFLSGRRSDMIKTGAHRVHPLDVEEAILELSGIVEAAVVGVDDELLGQTIKAFVVTDGALTIERIKAHCRERLAPYKIPKQIEMIAELPRTASGKIRRALLTTNIDSQGSP